MFSLKMNTGIFLDMLPDASISMEINNPMFADEVIPGSFSLPFDLPTTDRNRKELGYPELLNLSSKPAFRYSDVELWILGVPWKSGDLILRSFQGGNYRTNFQTDTSVLAEKFNDLNIRQLNHEIDQIFDWSTMISNIGPGYDGKKHLEYQILYGNVPNPLEVTVNGETFSSEAASGQDRLLAIETSINGADIGVICDVQLALAGGQNNLLRFRVTAPGLDPPLEVAIADSDPPAATLSEGWVSLYQGYIENTYRQLKFKAVIPDDYVLPGTLIEGFYEDHELNMTGIFNYFEGGNFKFKKTSIIDTEFVYHYYSFIPFFTLRYVLRKIEEATGVRFIGDFIEDEEFKLLILFNTHSLDYFTTENGAIKHTYMDVIDPAQHLPDLSVNEFLRQLSTQFCLGFDYNKEDNTIELYSLKSIADDLTYTENNSKFNPGYSIPEYTALDGFSLAYEWDENDELGTVDPFTSGAGEKEIVSKMSTVNMQIRQKPFSGHFYRIPVAKQPGTWYGKDPDGKTARLLFMRGEYPDSNGDNYKYASSDHLDLDSNNIGNYSLHWQGENGLYKLRWENWADIITNDVQVSRTAYWTITDLLNYYFKKKYRIDQVTWLVKKIKFSVNKRRIMPADIELVKAE